jgi:hypothetical protein
MGERGGRAAALHEAEGAVGVEQLEGRARGHGGEELELHACCRGENREEDGVGEKKAAGGGWKFLRGGSAK